MDDPLSGGFASRLADEDEEAEALSSADALLREPDISVRATAGLLPSPSVPRSHCSVIAYKETRIL